MQRLGGSAYQLVFLARHGRTSANAQDCFRGPLDFPLDSQGWKDANQLAALFQPIELQAIFHSDKKRTRETARLIAERNGQGEDFAPAESFPQYNLRGWDVGDLGGKPKNEENERIIEYHVEHPDIALPGGESLNDFRNRVCPLICDAVDIAQHCGLPVLLVAHSSVIHEVGNMLGGDHNYSLVEPGGVALIYMQNGQIDVKPIFKPKLAENPKRAEAMT